MVFSAKLKKSKGKRVLFYPRMSFAQKKQSRKNLLNQGGDFSSGFLEKYYLDLIKVNGNLGSKVLG